MKFASAATSICVCYFVTICGGVSPGADDMVSSVKGDVGLGCHSLKVTTSDSKTCLCTTSDDDNVTTTRDTPLV